MHEYYNLGKKIQKLDKEILEAECVRDAEILLKEAAAIFYGQFLLYYIAHVIRLLLIHANYGSSIGGPLNPFHVLHSRDPLRLLCLLF